MRLLKIFKVKVAGLLKKILLKKKNALGVHVMFPLLKWPNNQSAKSLNTSKKHPLPSLKIENSQLGM